LWRGCANDSLVEQLLIDGVGHAWYGGQHVNATEYVVDFFERAAQAQYGIPPSPRRVLRFARAPGQGFWEQPTASARTFGQGGASFGEGTALARTSSDGEAAVDIGGLLGGGGGGGGAGAEPDLFAQFEGFASALGELMSAAGDADGGAAGGDGWLLGGASDDGTPASTPVPKVSRKPKAGRRAGRKGRNGKRADDDGLASSSAQRVAAADELARTSGSRGTKRRSPDSDSGLRELVAKLESLVGDAGGGWDDTDKASSAGGSRAAV
jgi:hypothetical protein